MNTSYANIGKVNYSDSTNVVAGITTSVWFNSCPFRCVGCHNANIWDKEDLVDLGGIIDGMMTKTHLSLLGGEPLSDDNLQATETLIRMYKLKYPEGKVHIWTGYSYQEVLGRLSEYSIKHLFFVKVGVYEHDNKCKGRFYGSSNQEAYLLHEGQILARWSDTTKGWSVINMNEVV